MAETQAPHHYKFNIQMSCGGCSGAIDRVLKKTEGEHALSSRIRLLLALSFRECSWVLTMYQGIKSYNVSLENQTAEIYAEESLKYETVLEKIKKTGKQIKSGEKDGVAAEI